MGIFEVRAKNFWSIECEAWERAVKLHQGFGWKVFSDGVNNWDEEIWIWGIVIGKGDVEFEISNICSSVGVSRQLGIQVWDLRLKKGLKL